jgi:hypothetical protein
MANGDTEYEDPNGITRRLGNLRPTKKGPPKGFATYGTTPQTPVFKRTQWKDFIDMDGLDHTDFDLPPAHDQNGFGMCNCSATAGAMESRRSKQGRVYKHLSAGDLYRRICYQGGDNGSLLEDGIRAAMDEGIASVDTVPYLDWDPNHNFPGAKKDRKNYMVTNAFLCPTFDHCISAVIQGYDLISGIEWYQNYVPDDDGWLPQPAGGDVGGHAVHGYKATYKKVGSKIVYGIWHQNSWGPSWGLEGRCVFPEWVYDGQVGGWWAVVQVVQTDE